MGGISSNAAKTISMSSISGSIPGYESAWTSEVAGVANNNLMQFVHPQVKDWIIYQHCLNCLETS